MAGAGKLAAPEPPPAVLAWTSPRIHCDLSSSHLADVSAFHGRCFGRRHSAVAVGTNILIFGGGPSANLSSSVAVLETEPMGSEPSSWNREATEVALLAAEAARAAIAKAQAAQEDGDAATCEAAFAEAKALSAEAAALAEAVGVGGGGVGDLPACTRGDRAAEFRRPLLRLRFLPTQGGVAAGPSERMDGVMLRHGVDKILLYGGWRANNELGDMWRLELAPEAAAAADGDEAAEMSDGGGGGGGDAVD